METRPSPNQEALIRQAVEAGRFEHPEDALKEALALWEERERARAEFIETLDDAEASLARGEGTEITRQSLRGDTADAPTATERSPDRRAVRSTDRSA